MDYEIIQRMNCIGKAVFVKSGRKYLKTAKIPSSSAKNKEIEH